MKKILLMLLIILLVILAYYSIERGISIGDFKILSIGQIKENNDALDTEINEANKLIDAEYPSKMSSLKTAGNKMATAKKEYLDLTNVSTNDQILKATLEESYTIELLWAKIGRHVQKNGVTIEMAVASSDTGTKGLYNLNFTVNGSYLAIINFVEAIENDSILNFRIKNFKLLPYQGGILQAKFTVKNIAIQGNTSGQTINNSTRNSTNEANN